MSEMDHLAVRRSERDDVALRGRFRIAESHAGVVRLAKGSGVRDGVIEADVVDLSGVGIGLLTPVFLPKKVRVVCKVLLPNNSEVLECTGVVTRVVMTDRRPMYLIGLTFTEMNDESRVQFSVLLAELGEIG